MTTEPRQEAERIVGNLQVLAYEEGHSDGENDHAQADRHHEEFVAPARNQLVAALAALASFAERAPIAGSEIDGTPECSYCSGYFTYGEHEHDPVHHDHDCVWREAREALSALREGS